MNREQKSKHVHRVFENISKNYDKANDRISLGFQKKWKQMLVDRMVKKIPAKGKMLDVCCGTGDISIRTAKQRPDLKITGLDFSAAMLKEAKQKSQGLEILWREGDALSLPYEDNSFSAACISFGLRNTTDYKQVLKEMKRVVETGGFVYCLDSFVPEHWLIRPFYRLYFKYIMPYLGGGKEYYHDYFWLYESTQQFLRKQELISLYEATGFQKIEHCSRMYGACVLIQGKK